MTEADFDRLKEHDTRIRRDKQTPARSRQPAQARA
jgi:hypothetical protein